MCNGSISSSRKETLSALHTRKELLVQSTRALLVLKYRDEVIAAVRKQEDADNLAKFSVHLLGEFLLLDSWDCGC